MGTCMRRCPAMFGNKKLWGRRPLSPYVWVVGRRCPRDFGNNENRDRRPLNICVGRGPAMPRLVCILGLGMLELVCTTLNFQLWRCDVVTLKFQFWRCGFCSCPNSSLQAITLERLGAVIDMHDFDFNNFNFDAGMKYESILRIPSFTTLERQQDVIKICRHCTHLFPTSSIAPTLNSSSFMFLSLTAFPTNWVLAGRYGSRQWHGKMGQQVVDTVGV